MQEIAKDIFQEQSPKQLYAVRGKLYELLVNCLPPELILRKLALALMRTLDDEVRHKCIDLAASYEHRLQASTSGAPPHGHSPSVWSRSGFILVPPAMSKKDVFSLSSDHLLHSEAARLCAPNPLSECQGKTCYLKAWLLQEGQKAIYHLEAFVAKMMSEYKTWSIAVLG